VARILPQMVFQTLMPLALCGSSSAETRRLPCLGIPRSRECQGPITRASVDPGSPALVVPTYCGMRIFTINGGVEQPLIREASSPANAGYWDDHAVMKRPHTGATSLRSYALCVPMNRIRHVRYL
jgi:hypothetical protein